MSEIFELECAALGDDVRLVGFHGREELSHPYRYHVYLTLPLDGLPAASSVVGAKTSLRIQPDQSPADQIHGVVSEYQIFDQAAERALVVVAVTPRLAHVGLSLHSRVFTKKSPIEVITAVLEGAGLAAGTDFAFELDGSYAALEHVCQYKESDLAFISRWMEREGLYYFFDHGGDVDKLVVTDHKSKHEQGPDEPVRYVPRAASHGAHVANGFDRFRSRRVVQPSAVRCTDYDYTRPAMEVAGEANAAETSAARVVVHGIPTDAPGDAKRLAAVRAAALLAAECTYHCEGLVFRLHAGQTFEVAEHPRDTLNRRYLCSQVELHGALRATTDELRRLVGIHGSDVYRVQLTALDASVQYRTPLRTPVPHIHALERATVDGPADSDYAQLDEAGRYHVKLACDESDLSGDKSSLPVRMMQPHAGNPEGWHLPLRKGTEVALGFVDGHPDRPFIAHTLPNAETPSPVTSANNTHDIFITGGRNVLEIEDQDGAQWCDWRSPTQDTYLHLGKPHVPTHYIVGHTDADCLFSIGGNQDIRVGGKLTESVTGDVTETYHTSQTTGITATQTTTVLNDVIEEYTGGQKTDVTGAVTEMYLSTQSTTVTGARFEFYNAQQQTLVSGAVTETFNAAQNLSVIGPSDQLYQSSKTTLATGAVTFNFDSDVTQRFGPVFETHATTEWTMGPSTLHTHALNIVSGGHEGHSAMMHLVEEALSEAFGVYFCFAATKIEAFAISVVAGAFKYDQSAIAREAFLGKIELCGVTLGAHAAHSETAPTHGH